MTEISLSQVLFMHSLDKQGTKQRVKSMLSGRPETEEIPGELVVYLTNKPQQ